MRPLRYCILWFAYKSITDHINRCCLRNETVNTTANRDFSKSVSQIPRRGL
jgi:hypothetical protein